MEINLMQGTSLMEPETMIWRKCKLWVICLAPNSTARSNQSYIVNSNLHIYIYIYNNTSLKQLSLLEIRSDKKKNKLDAGRHQCDIRDLCQQNSLFPNIRWIWGTQCSGLVPTSATEGQGEMTECSGQIHHSWIFLENNDQITVPTMASSLSNH